MKLWIKNKLKRSFDLVDRADNERMWERRRADTDRYTALANSYESMAHAYTRLALSLEQERKRNDTLTMEMCILRVGPTETMDRALSLFLAGDLEKGIEELENGISLIRKQPSMKGATK